MFNMFQTVLAFLLQSALFAITEAAPITTQSSDPLGYHIGGGIAGFIVLVLDIIVWIEVLKSTRPVPEKILWSLLVFIFPIIGVIIYFLFSKREAHKKGYQVIP